jgi:hypothetical protein
MTFTTSPISAEEAPSFTMVAWVSSATRTAEAATSAASLAPRAIVLIATPISSAPAATVPTLVET